MKKCKYFAKKRENFEKMEIIQTKNTKSPRTIPKFLNKCKILSKKLRKFIKKDFLRIQVSFSKREFIREPNCWITQNIKLDSRTTRRHQTFRECENVCEMQPIFLHFFAKRFVRWKPIYTHTHISMSICFNLHYTETIARNNYGLKTFFKKWIFANYLFFPSHNLS